MLIADDHTLFREGLSALLAREPDISVVGEATNSLEALRMAKALQPDVMLLDIRMPGTSGLEVLHRIREEGPKIKVLVLSGFFEEELLVEAFEHGAKGYLQKITTHAELVKAVRATHAGEVWAEPKVLSQVLDSLLEKVNAPHLALSEMHSELTDREKEVVQRVTQGQTNKEIATDLGISEKTVKSHLSNVFNKLNIGRRLQLLLYRIADRTK
ncbi:MAG: response regulator transcription factor [Candidatus Methylomirabilis oxyfera]|nr:response regulator transcription factor [Candidatus Methylomirabilis oxyfera]